MADPMAAAGAALLNGNGNGNGTSNGNGESTNGPAKVLGPIKTPGTTAGPAPAQPRAGKRFDGEMELPAVNAMHEEYYGASHAFSRARTFSNVSCLGCMDLNGVD